MNLQVLFDQLAEIQDTGSRNDKEDVLASILSSQNSDQMKFIAAFVCDPYRKIYIKVSDDVLSLTDEVVEFESDLEIWGYFVWLLRKLERRSITGNEARRNIANFLQSIPLDYYEWFVSIFNQDLKAGIGQKILEKYIPEVAQKFSVQLCPSKQWDGKFIPRDGWLVSPKIDGIRGIIGPFGDTTRYHGYVSRSRKGLPLHNTEHIIEELAGVAEMFHRWQGVWPVFDGELYTHGWELSSSVTSTQSIHPQAGNLQYHVFDILTVSDWHRAQSSFEAQFRDGLLGYVLNKTSDSIVHVPSIISVDPDEVKLIAQSYVDDGYEGAVLKGVRSFYEFGRTKAWMKFKPFLDEDLIVVGLNLGWLDIDGMMYEDGDPRARGERERAVRSLVVSKGGVKTNIGSGLTHGQRKDFCKCPEKVVGKTVEVRYQRMSEDGRLIFPRFRGVRLDK